MHAMPTPRQLDQLELDAWAAFYDAAPAAFKLREGMACFATENGAGFTLRTCPFSFAGFNAVRLRPGVEPAADTQISHGVDWARRHVQSMHSVEAFAPPGCATRAQFAALGYAEKGRKAQFWRRNEPAPAAPSPIEIREIDAATAADFAGVAAAVFGLPEHWQPWLIAAVGQPGWQVYVGYLNGAAVSCGAMFRQGEAAWLGWGATLPAHRGQGGQRALLARRLQDGIAAGVQVFVIETGYPLGDEPLNGSHRNVVRAGFILSHVRHLFAPAQCTG